MNDMYRQLGSATALNVQKADLTDDEALKVKSLHKVWKSGESVEIGDRRQYLGLLYKCRQAHTTQDTWTPDAYPSGWEVIDEVHEGAQADPIPYNVGMELLKGKYYTDDGVLYVCTRATEAPIYAELRAVIGIYVGVAEVA